MGEVRREAHSFHTLLPADIEGFERLVELALDVRWALNHAADTIWKRLEAQLWGLTHSSWGIL